MRRRRGKRARHRESVVSEIELMPMLNVFISIIPLLLLSAAFVPVTVIKTTLPSDQAVTAEEAAPLSLAIHIHPRAFQLEIDGKIVGNIARDPGEGESGAIRARKELEEALQAIAAEHPGHREVQIVSEPRTRYEEIVGAMDAARAAGLPEATLAEAVEGS